MDGIVNVYKEQGFTSFDVVAKLRGIFKIKKIGHTGTLDPMATGVLPVCIGRATKLCDMLTDKSKEYVTTFKLGISTDTQDITGEVLSEREVNVSKDDILSCINSFVGEISQLTPMYSARKVNGKKLYEYARAGIEVERKSTRVNIYSITDIEFLSDTEISMRVNCEKGTYIRTLCNDIGEKLGCGATMTSLKRTRVDIFEIDNAITLDDISNLKEADRLDACVIPLEIMFLKYQKLSISEELEKYVVNGNKLRCDNFEERIEDNEYVRLYNTRGELMAIYIKEGDELKVKMMLL